MHACPCLWCPILDAHILLHFGQAKVWVEDDWDAASSFCFLRLCVCVCVCVCVCASCLSASNLRLAFLTDEHQLSRSKASCYHDNFYEIANMRRLFLCQQITNVGQLILKQQISGQDNFYSNNISLMWNISYSKRKSIMRNSSFSKGKPRLLATLTITVNHYRE